MIRLALLALLLFLIEACKNPESDRVVALSSPAGPDSGQPHLFTDSANQVFLSWIEKRDNTYFFQFSRWENNRWTDAILITEGRNWFVNWADYPMLASDGKGNLIAHVLTKSGEATFSYDIKMYASTNQGISWSEPFILHDDEKQAEHGFVTILPYRDQAFVAWLDGRNMAKDGTELASDHGNHGAMTLRAAFVDHKGNKLAEWELDNKTCDCCQTAATITDNGPVVIYRDRSNEEVRDMSIVRWVNDKWTQPQSIHDDGWQIAACPVNGPRVSSIGNYLGIAWYSAPDGKPQVNFVFSKNGGEDFGEPIRVDDGSPIGRVDVVMLDQNHSLVSWMEGPEIKAIKVGHDGKKGATMTIAASSTARASGFPQMTKVGNDIIFAWTDDTNHRIRVARLTL